MRRERDCKPVVVGPLRFAAARSGLESDSCPALYKVRIVAVNVPLYRGLLITERFGRFLAPVRGLW